MLEGITFDVINATMWHLYGGISDAYCTHVRVNISLGDLSRIRCYIPPVEYKKFNLGLHTMRLCTGVKELLLQQMCVNGCVKSLG